MFINSRNLYSLSIGPIFGRVVDIDYSLQYLQLIMRFMANAYFLYISNNLYSYYAASASLIHSRYEETLVYALGLDVVQSAAP